MEHKILNNLPFLSKDEPFYPGNLRAIRTWTINHGALAISGLFLALSQGSGLAGLVIPMVSFLGCAALIPLLAKYDTKAKVHPLVKVCEISSMASIALCVASKIPGVASLLGSLGVNGIIVSAGLALTARALAVIPYIADFVKEALKPDVEKGFPQLISLNLWTLSTVLGAATVTLPLTSAAIVPLGYAIHNLILSGIALASFGIWRKRVSENKQGIS